MKTKKAFTLIELLVVIAIIGVLATISVIALSNARAKSRDAKRAGDMKQIQTALELFFNDKGRYPTFDEFSSGSILSTSTNFDTSTYMQIIPAASSPADGGCTNDQNAFSYTQTEGGNSYAISFCLGNTTGSLTPGPKCLTPGGIVDTNCLIYPFTAYFAGGSGKDVPADIMMDGSNIYMVGNYSAATVDGGLMKYDKNTLRTVAAARYGGGANDSYKALTLDDSYIYVAGAYGNEQIMLTKYNKSDLSLAGQIYHLGSATDYANTVAVDDNYVYIGGRDDSSIANSAATIIKYDKNNFSNNQKMVYNIPGSSYSEMINKLIVSGNYIYAVGQSNDNGNDAALVMKINKSDLSLASANYLSGFSSETFFGLTEDAGYLYAVGSTNSIGAGQPDCLIAKIDKTDLSIDAQKIYGGSLSDNFRAIAINGSDLYAIGEIFSEGSANGNILLIKYDKNDLSILEKKIIYNAAGAGAKGVIYNDYLYISAYSNMGVSSQDFSLMRLKNLKSGTLNTSPAGLTWQTSNLTEQNSTLTAAASSITTATSSLTDNTTPLTSAIFTPSDYGPYVIN